MRRVDKAGELEDLGPSNVLLAGADADGCSMDGLEDNIAGNVLLCAPEVYARGGRGHHVGDIASVDEGGVERASR